MSKMPREGTSEVSMKGAAEWGAQCLNNGHDAIRSQGTLCVDCANTYARQHVEATKHQAREELASILNGKSPLVMDPIFDALTVATALVGREMKRVEAFALEGKVCGVCWTSSWTPIPPEEEKECGLNHPHEGDHARCECCWLQALVVSTRREALEEAEKLARDYGTIGAYDNRGTVVTIGKEIADKVAALKEGRDGRL